MQPEDPNMPPQAVPRKRHHYIRWTLAGFGALILAIVVIGVAAGSGTKATPAAHTSTSAPAAAAAAQAIDPNGEQCAALDGSGYCPGDAPTATPTPTVNPATTVTFTVTGWGDPSITYGTDSDNRDGGGTLGQLGDGNATPWTRSMTFDGTAQYYYISAQLEGGGAITCKIVASGPGDDPLTVATGHASGGYNVCSAQAAPSDSTGTNWQTEG